MIRINKLPVISYCYFIILLALCGACATPHTTLKGIVPTAPDYADTANWATSLRGMPCDVFYITPTCVFDSKTDSTICHYYDVLHENQKENFAYSILLAEDIFGDSCNFYAPYYRQISLESWVEGPSAVDSRFPIAWHDIENSFRYYMAHYNNGRPFIIAGFSQGAKGVVEVLKTLSDKERQQLVAAYVIGYKITENDLEGQRITPAQNATDVGVTICFNSVASPSNCWPILSEGNQICINPVSWSLSEQSVPLHDSTRVQLDNEHHLLLVSHYETGLNEIKLLKGIMPTGCYHLSELTLYQQSLHNNVLDRIQSYFSQKQHSTKH